MVRTDEDVVRRLLPLRGPFVLAFFQGAVARAEFHLDEAGVLVAPHTADPILHFEVAHGILHVLFDFRLPPPGFWPSRQFTVIFFRSVRPRSGRTRSGGQNQWGSG